LRIVGPGTEGRELTANRNRPAHQDRGDRSPTNHQSAFNRSKITNGKNLLPGVHKQSLWARRFYDIVDLYARDQGGDDRLSEARRSIIRRCACLQVELELLETRFALAGGAEPGTLDLYQRTANSLRRLCESVGMDRVPRDITPSLSDYIAAHAHSRATEEAEAS
jgi:hypothetical protein